MQVLVGKLRKGFLGSNANIFFGNKIRKSPNDIHRLIEKYMELMMGKN